MLFFLRLLFPKVGWYWFYDFGVGFPAFDPKPDQCVGPFNSWRVITSATKASISRGSHAFTTYGKFLFRAPANSRRPNDPNANHYIDEI